MKDKKIVAGVIVIVLLAGCVEHVDNEIEEVPLELEIYTYSLEDYFTITAIGLPYPAQEYFTTNCVFVPIENEIHRVQLEVRWDAESPLVENLLLWGMRMEESVNERGPSPLLLDLENPTPREGATHFGFAIWIPDPAVAVQQVVSISMKVDYLEKEDFRIHYGTCT